VGLKWSELSLPWQVCFQETCQAYLNGTVPIGAVLIGPQGEIISRGRNQIFVGESADSPGLVRCHKLAHAELNALLAVGSIPVDFRNSTIYSAVEPCPLCMGAIYMCGVRQIRYAVSDPYAGSTDMLESTPYLSRKKVKASADAPKHLEIILAALNLEFFVRQGVARRDAVWESWIEAHPLALNLCNCLTNSAYFLKVVEGKPAAEEVFTELNQTLERLKNDNTENGF
jgi:tRNA(Arg) A34 adenosine deaminase TadA